MLPSIFIGSEKKGNNGQKKEENVRRRGRTFKLNIPQKKFIKHLNLLNIQYKNTATLLILVGIN